MSNYNVTVTGQVGAIANVVITDNGADRCRASRTGWTSSARTGSIVIPIDVTALADGTITITVTLTNGSGNSYATTLTEYKDTIAPPLTVSLPPYVNNQNAASVPISLTGEKLDPFTYSFTQGKTTCHRVVEDHRQQHLDRLGVAVEVLGRPDLLHVRGDRRGREHDDCFRDPAAGGGDARNADGDAERGV